MFKVYDRVQLINFAISLLTSQELFLKTKNVLLQAVQIKMGYQIYSRIPFSFYPRIFHFFYSRAFFYKLSTSKMTVKNRETTEKI